MGKSKDALIVFQKNPVLGKVKTRLAITTGDEKALEIYQYLLKHTYHELSLLENVAIHLFFSDYLEPVPATLAAKNPILALQSGADLGERMLLAFQQVFAKNYDKVIIIGTDCLEINSVIIQESFSALDNFNAVFGPAFDGGYYLMGMGSLVPDLFHKIPWSTDKVLADSIAALKQKNITYQLLPVLHDIDTEFDWMKFLKSNPQLDGKLFR